MKVTLFATCLVDMFQSSVGKARVELLEHLECEIDSRNHKLVVVSPPITVAMFVKMGQISEQMVDEKVSHVEETGAEYLIGASVKDDLRKIDIQ